MSAEKGSILPATSLISERGFLPSEDPLKSFNNSSKRLTEIDELAAEIPGRLADHTFRSYIDKRNHPFSASGLQGRSLERAWTVLSFAASGYIHQIGEQPRNYIHENLAMPMAQMAHTLDKPPILAYDGYDLYNWQRIDPEGPIEVDNLRTLVNFTDLEDEQRFITVHTEIENEAAPALLLLPGGQAAAQQGDTEGVFNTLHAIAESTEAMVETQGRMKEANRPDIYHGGFRPYIEGFTNVYYAGVAEFDNAAMTFRGETGAQSSIMPSFDAALGIGHEDTPMVKHTKDMRTYMPHKHRLYIARLESSGDAIREFVGREQDSGLTEEYNRSLENMAAFRGQHLTWAKEYIADKVEDPHGTGGTVFMPWLSQMRDETRAAML